MSKNLTIFVCSNCGEEYMRWQGKCENCQSWNSLREFRKTEHKKDFIPSALSEVVNLAKVVVSDIERITTGIDEFDRVLGGNKKAGIVPGSIILLGGDPGIGKSTMLLQTAAKINNLLYISGEESPSQIKMRFDRLNLDNTSRDIKILAETNLESISQAIDKERPAVVIVDSIQTIYSSSFPSTPGSVVQVRECAMALQQIAKTKNTAVILVGHVTKEGSVAGPRTLEHLVDVVLYLEGERFQNIRILRGVKNRFGATDEIGVFEMTDKGLKEVSNPSHLFLSERNETTPGSVVTATVEGTRAILVEIQALTNGANFGYPQRRANGFDQNRLQMLIAVLQKRGGIDLSNQDIFINVAGGVKIYEPSVDLAVVLAIVSAYKGKSISPKLCAFGEVGLTGEIRSVALESKRLSEAKRLGFDESIKSKNIKEAINERI